MLFRFFFFSSVYFFQCIRTGFSDKQHCAGYNLSSSVTLFPSLWTCNWLHNMSIMSQFFSISRWNIINHTELIEWLVMMINAQRLWNGSAMNYIIYLNKKKQQQFITIEPLNCVWATSTRIPVDFACQCVNVIFYIYERRSKWFEMPKKNGSN